MTLTQCTKQLERSWRAYRAARDTVYDAGAMRYDMTFSECLAACPPSIREQYHAASKAHDEAERAAIDNGYCYREASMPSLLWWIKTPYRVGLVSFKL